MFIKKVREEHVQIINLINTSGAQSVINRATLTIGLGFGVIGCGVEWQVIGSTDRQSPTTPPLISASI